MNKTQFIQVWELIPEQIIPLDIFERYKSRFIRWTLFNLKLDKSIEDTANIIIKLYGVIFNSDTRIDTPYMYINNEYKYKTKLLIKLGMTIKIGIKQPFTDMMDYIVMSDIDNKLNIVQKYELKQITNGTTGI